MKWIAPILLLLPPYLVGAQTGSMQPDSVLNQATLRLDSLQQSFGVQSDSILASYSREKQRLVLLKQQFTFRLDSLNNTNVMSGNPSDTLVHAAEISRYMLKALLKI